VLLGISVHELLDLLGVVAGKMKYKKKPSARLERQCLELFNKLAEKLASRTSIR